MIVENETIFSKPQNIIRRLLKGEFKSSLLKRKSLGYLKEKL